MKKLHCGCIILAVSVNATGKIEGHSYKNICHKCKEKYSEEQLEERLVQIYEIDYDITTPKGWYKVE
jgi:hypothetical protein